MSSLRASNNIIQTPEIFLSHLDSLVTLDKESELEEAWSFPIDSVTPTSWSKTADQLLICIIVLIIGQWRRIVTAMFFESLRFGDQSAFQYNPTLFVFLGLVRGVFVHPSQFGLAFLTGYISHHVSSCQHDSVLNFTEFQVDDLVE